MRHASTIRALRRAGFTMIEMSVVLMIIALIIGGVMVGQEMAHSAEINSLVSDVNRIKTGISTFQFKYDALPGDMINATDYWPATANGNGDLYVNSGTSNYWTDNSEMYRAWQQLGLSGMLPGNYSGVSNSATDVASAVAINGNVMGNRLDGFYLIVKNQDTFHDGNMIGMWGGNPTLSLLSPTDSQTVDRKLDDGRPGTGKVTTNLSVAACVSGGGTPITAQYNGSDTIACNLAFWLD